MRMVTVLAWATWRGWEEAVTTAGKFAAAGVTTGSACVALECPGVVVPNDTCSSALSLKKAPAVALTRQHRLLPPSTTKMVPPLQYQPTQLLAASAPSSCVHQAGLYCHICAIPTTVVTCRTTFGDTRTAVPLPVAAEHTSLALPAGYQLEKAPEIQII